MILENSKSAREALCAAQSALHERADAGVDVDRVPVWVGWLQTIIDSLDEARKEGRP